jgi:hypothetical protein
MPSSPPQLVPPSSPLARLRGGDTDVEAYLQQKVLEAMHHLRDLPPRPQERVRSLLLERLRTDPALVALVRLAVSGL